VLDAKIGPMATKSQHASDYQPLPGFLRMLREEAGLTQRDLGERMKKPQSWIFNCESANRRVDVSEFILWARACDAAPCDAFGRFVTLIDRSGRRRRGGQE
jgi:transcriptional regulator with XRE-family HTH domain